jgi:hypothetical protein
MNGHPGTPFYCVPRYSDIHVYDLPGIVGRFSLSPMKNRILPIEPSDRP